MPLEIVRDTDGRPIAIRIQVPDLRPPARMRSVADAMSRRVALGRTAFQPYRWIAAMLAFIRSALPSLALHRDEDGRPAAIKIGIPQWHVRQRSIAAIRAVRARLPRLPRLPRRVVLAYYNILNAILYVIPEIEMRRDPFGRPEEVAFRFGGRVATPRDLSAAEERPRQEPLVVPILKWSNEPRRPGLIATAIEVWHYRRFVNFLGAKSFRKLYARTMLGWSWVFITPLFPILLNLFVFGALIGMTSEGVPYFLFLTIGNLSWDFFASALMWSTRGLEMHRKVIDRVYVPRVILPVATMTPAIFNFLINFAVTVLVVAYYWIKDGTPYLTMGMNSLWSVAALIMIVTLVLGISMFTSVWGETARDARFTLGNVIQFWFLATPVLYPTSQVPPQYQKWLVLNPMAAFVEAFKYGFFRTSPPDVTRFLVGSVMAVLLLTVGLFFFSWRGEIEETQLA